MGDNFEDREVDASRESSSSEEPRPVLEVYGSAKNIRQHGSPIQNADRPNAEIIRYYFYPTWRSQFFHLFGFFALSLLCIYVSRQIPILVIPGKLFTIGGITFYLYFPILSLIPMSLLGKILMNVYDAKYIIDEGGVEAQVGLVSFNLRQPRLRWEDIRGSEPQQTLWERVLGIGTVLVGSAMTQDVEIAMSGVANPRAIQLLIQDERERRTDELKVGNASHGRAAAVLSD